MLPVWFAYTIRLRSADNRPHGSIDRKWSAALRML